MKEAGRSAVRTILTYAPVDCGDEVKELCELVNFLSPAPRRGHVMSEMVNVVPLPVVKA